MARTLVCFHAHPDDEALLTAGVMAKAAQEGHRVVLVVATRGEVGMVSTDFLGGESLGTIREAEQRAAADLLGVHRLEFLGYADSGLGGTGGSARNEDDPTLGPFATADVDDAAARLATILIEEGADVVTVYDPNGGYHHPDHLQVHRVGYLAAEMAGTPVVLEATINRDLMKMGAELAAGAGLDLPPELSPDTFDTWFLPNDELTHAIDVSAFLDQKKAAMRAHTSQATGDEGPRSIGMFLAVPEEFFGMAFGTEWFTDRNRQAGTAVTDIFAGLDSD